MEKRQRDLIEMLIKQAGYKESGQMYVNNDVRSAFGIKELFPDEPSDNPSYESLCSQLLRANQRIKELETELENKNNDK